MQTVKEIVESMLQRENRQLLAIKQAPKKFLKVPSYVYKNSEYTVLFEVKKIDEAFFAVVQGNRQNQYSAVFVVIKGFVFELDEYAFEALGMGENLLNFYYEVMGQPSENYAFSF